jgi:DNA end-binding protein Ku
MELPIHREVFRDAFPVGAVMPGHVAWKGHLRLSLVSVPIRAYTAARSGGNPISLNQLHRECHNRIRYKKTCPEHGEVPSDEIVMGYEFAKDEYVVIDPDELDKLRTEKDRSINVAAFAPVASIDPTYFAGKAYYLVPDGNVGDKPYALLRQALTDMKLCGIAQVVITSREHLVMVRAVDKLLVMNLLEYAAELKSPADFDDDVPGTTVNKEELKLTRTLVKAMEQPEPKLEQYHDVYYEKLQELIEAKMEGREVVTPPAAAPPRVVNFIDALKASMKQVQSPRAPARKASAARKTSGGHAAALRHAKKSAASKKRRKSG